MGLTPGLGIVTLAAALALLTAPASAQATLEQRAAFERVLQTAIDEHRVFLTCGALDAETSQMIEKTWREMVSDTIPILQRAGYTPAEVIAFADRTEARNLVDAEARYAEIVAFCRAHDWRRNLSTFRVVLLHREARRIFRGRGE